MRSARPIYIILLVTFSALSIGLRAEAAQSQASDYPGNASTLSSLRLKGTLFTRSLKPLAVIEDIRSAQVTMYELGDILGDGFEIAHITRGEIVLKGKKGRKKLSFPIGAVLQPRAAGQKKGPWQNIRRQGSTFVLDEATVANAARNIRGIMKNVSVKPFFIDGRASGMVVAKLNPLGILGEIGVKQGDIIESMNGAKLNTPHQIFRAYRTARGKSEVKVDIIRDNKPLRLTYRIKRTQP